MRRPSQPARHRAASAVVAELRLLAAVAGLLLLGQVSVAHEIGDFGRVKPGFMNDEAIPAIDSAIRWLDRQPVSNFNWTDQEREMHDRVYRFLIARDVKDWAFDYEHILMVASVVSTRPTNDDLYYRWLTTTRYASSRVRYNRMADDIGADLLTLPSTFDAICAVEVVDGQRSAAAAELTDIEPEVIAQMRTRHAENGLYVGRFVGALRYRYASYSYALDHFLVETPHAEAVRVDEGLSEMAGWVDRAEAGEFCIDDWAGGDHSGAALPGRVLIGDPDEGMIRK
jgi:hypothetical protein